MPQLLIPDLDEHTLAVLRQRADRNGRTVEAEARHILADATRADPAARWAAIDAFPEGLAATGRDFGDSTEELREDRARRPRPWWIPASAASGSFRRSCRPKPSACVTAGSPFTPRTSWKWRSRTSPGRKSAAG